MTRKRCRRRETALRIVVSEKDLYQPTAIPPISKQIDFFFFSVKIFFLVAQPSWAKKDMQVIIHKNGTRHGGFFSFSEPFVFVEK